MDSLPAWWTFFWPPGFSQTNIFFLLGLISTLRHFGQSTHTLNWTDYRLNPLIKSKENYTESYNYMNENFKYNGTMYIFIWNALLQIYLGPEKLITSLALIA